MESMGQMAGGVAHDFNNILMVIRASTSFLDERADLDATARADVEAIDEAAGRAVALTTQLLAFARRQPRRLERLDLDQVVVAGATLLRRVLGENITLLVEPRGSLPPIEADRGQLELVLLNLAINARDAMPSGGTLRIATEAGHGAVHLLVRDDGTGMAPETVARVFEPFFTTKPPGKGTGLGLSIVHGIVHQSGGTVRVESGLGIGTTFDVVLPIAGPEGAGEGPRLAAGRVVRGRGETVLLAEDDAALRRALGRVITHCGYTVLSAPDGPSAVALAREHPGAIHALVSDVVMPGLGGPELAALLRAERPGLAVVLMSGHSEREIGPVPFGLRSRFLPKPIDRLQMCEALHAVLNEPLAHDIGPHGI
jgi:CheY-like chemotaxis protein